MSLYVGNIPRHVRARDLEQVFQRFGHCKLQLKDGYGFAVFKVTAAAESALHALRGKDIFGAPISIDWSSRQPRPIQRQPKPIQRSGRPHQIYDPPHRRRKFRILEDRRDLSANSHGRHQDDVLDRGPEGRREATLKEELTYEVNTSEPNPNPVANDRWDELVGAEFDRYEPYHGENRHEKENNRLVNSFGSPSNGINERTGRNHSIDEVDKKKFDNDCGVVGHVKRNCPEGNGRREKFNKLIRYRDEVKLRERNDRKRKMPRTSSRGRLDANRDHLISRERRESHLGRSRKFDRRSDSRPNLRAESQAKERSEPQRETGKQVTKRRRFETKSLSSDSSSTHRSHNLGTSKSKSHDSSSTSKSISSRSRSASSSSTRSASTSSYFKSKSSRSRSTSRSSSRKSSSVSLDLKPSSPPKNVNINASGDTSHKVNLEHSVIPSANHTLHNSTDARKVNNEINREPSRVNGEDVHYSASSSENKDTSSGINTLKDKFSVSKNSEEKCEGKNHNRITGEEMVVALKHYGLPVPEEGASGISAEGYFGAARLWPWEMIYYRRLRKGPISIENYAKRLEQNREFGIVDKFVRSSSGWGERDHNDPH